MGHQCSGCCTLLGLCQMLSVVPNAVHFSLELQLMPAANTENQNLLDQQYQLKARTFNAGVRAFSTDVISEANGSELRNLFRQYAPVLKHYEQTVMNLWRQNRWQRLPFGLNAQLCIFKSRAERSLG